MPNTYWSEEEFLRPAFISDEAWQQIFGNFLTHIGDPVGDLPGALEDDLDRLESLGISDPNMLAALRFEIEQAGDFGTLAERAGAGSMGQGWSSLADIRLLSSPDGSVVISGLVNAGTLAALDATRTAQYAVSLPLGKIIGQDGRLAEGAAFVRLSFTTNQMTHGDMTLAAAGGGHELTAGNGDKFIFDEDGKLTSFVSATGEEIDVVYDMNDRISRFENAFGDFLEFTYDMAGKIEAVEDGNERVVSFDYSGDELAAVEDDAGDTDFTYDGNGNLLTAQRVGGPELTFTYDAEGRVDSQDIGGEVAESYTYDDAGAITITNGLSEETVIQMGPGGYVAGVENNLGQAVTITTDPETRTVTIEDANNVQSELVYDPSGRLQSVTDGNGDTISFAHDSATGRLITFTDGEGGVREFDYDGAGRLLTATWDDETFLDFEYDLDGNLTEFTNRRDQTVEYEYDERGRVTDVSDSASGTLEYIYDSRGNVTSITSSAGLTEITYDGADRITLIEYPNGRSLEYTYDSDGKRLSMTNQDDEGTFYAYDDAGRLETISDDNGVLVTYDYDTAGRLTLETNANGSYTEYGYDGAGRLDEITNYDSSPAVTSFFQYTYDAAGRKVEAVTNDGTWEYDYDDAGQLIEATFTSTTMGIPNKSIEYQYDDAGNRIATIEDTVTTNYTTNGLNQYEAAGSKSFTYDDDGNLTAQTQTSNNYAYVYDIDNRLIQVTRPDSTVITYEYDAFGNRSAIVDDGVRTEFLVDPFGLGNVVAEYDSMGARIASYAHGLGLASRTDAGGNLAFFDVDATGSVVGMTDDAGDLANSYIYTPFGDELYESETIDNSFEFNGAFGVTEDAENLHYMRARSYDVELGRFLSEDPLFLDGDIANLYRFGYNDPVQFVDPNGENPLLALGAAVGVAGLAYSAGVFGAVFYEASQTSNLTYRGELYKQLIPGFLDLYGNALGSKTGIGGLFSTARMLNDLSPQGGNDGDGDGRSDGGQGGGEDDDDDGGRGPQPPQKPNREDDQGSPLVFDLDGDGVELYAVADYGTYFDLRGNGQAVLTGWVEPDDGLLARDVNGNGRIDDITELFGTMTTDGFTVLAAHDTNADGVIDANDTVFEDLLIWTDTNSDGISQSGELHALSEFNIESINLNATRLADVRIEGNEITHESTYTMTGDVERTVVDAWFTFNPAFTHSVESYDFDIRSAFLPTLRGFGDLKDLHIAASLDNGTDPDTIMEQLIALADGMTLTDALEDWATTESAVEDLLLTWAGAESVNPTSRGDFVDARHLAFNEAFRGEPFSQYGQPDPLPEAGQYSEAVFQHILTHSMIQIVAQVAGAEIFEGGYYDLYTAGMQGDLALTQDGIDAVETAAIAAGAGGGDVWARFAQFLGYTKGLGNLTGGEITALDTAVDNSGVAGLDDWQDVVSAMTVTYGSIIDSPDDWGSFEIFYDNLVTGTSGNDSLTDPGTGGFFDNELQGLAGDDTISGLSGHDKILGGSGDDTLIGGDGDDYLLGGPDDDIYIYESGNDTISEEGGDGYDELHIASSTGLGETNITDLFRFGDELILSLDTGSLITIHGYNGTDTRIEKIIFDYDSYEIDLENILEERFYGTEGADDITASGLSYQTLLAYGYDGNDILRADGSAAEFYGGGGYDTLIGDFLGDVLYGENSDDYLLGYGGNDTLVGGNGSDWLDGGAGDDVLYGDALSGAPSDAGSDTFLFGLGDGNDVVKRTISSSDRVIFKANVAPADLELYRDTSSQGLRDLKFIITSSGESLTIDDMYSKNGSWLYTIQTFQFSDGTIWTDESLREKYISDNTTSGNDVTLGFEGNDIFLSSAGNDVFRGYSGNDTYFWGTGAGNDFIFDQLMNVNNGGVSDRIIFGDLKAGDLTFEASGDNLVVTNTNTQETLTVDRQLHGTSFYHVEYFEFADETVLSEDVIEGLVNGSVSGTAGDDILAGSALGESINGLGGNDTIFGNGGDDILIGGAGDDDLDGGDGVDTVSYAAAAGGVVVDLSSGTASDDGDGGEDTLSGIENVIGSAYADDITGDSNDNVVVGGAGDDDLDGGDGEDTVSYAAAAAGVNVVLSTGVVSDDGDGGEDTLSNIENVIGSAYADDILGDTGDNVIEGGAGDDTLNGGAGGNDTLSYASAASGITISLASGSAQNTSGAGTDTVSNFDNVIGSAYADTITGGSTDNVLYGMDGNDTLYGAVGNDTLYGGAGDDLLKGWHGADTIYGGEGEDEIYGENDNDTIYGGDDDDTISGDSGNDTIYGDAGNDTLIGGGNHDTLYGGAGNDDIDGTAGNDTLYGDDGNDTMTGGSGIDELHGGADADTMYGDDGDDVLYGDDGNDIIYGGTGHDDIYGGAGADTLYAGTGAGADTKIDKFFFESGTAFDAVDTIYDFSGSGGDGDKINIYDVLDFYGYDPLTHTLADWVNITAAGGDSTVQIDRDGTGGTYSFTDIVDVIDYTVTTNDLVVPV